MSDVGGFWAVVPAGGAGTRLWPLSRAGRPKFLLDLTGEGRTLLQATVDRLAPLAADRVVVVTGTAHADAVRSQLPQVPRQRVVAEPSPRDSMAAIGLAAALVERSDPDAVVGSFAADHVVPDAGVFHDAVREAVDVARDGHLVTLGVEPTHPATGFGYIRAGDPVEGFPTALHALEFVEKPDAERAAAYLAAGGYRWNAGMFVVRAGTLLDLLAQWHPELSAGLRAVAEDPDRLPDVWPGLERIAIDHAVAEPAAAQGRVVVVPAPFAWDDVGDFAGLSGLVPGDGGPVTVVGDAADVSAVDAEGLVVAGSGRRVAVVGLEDVVVVDTPDALLVTTRERAQDVKAVVDALKAEGRTDLT
ncbi:NTP transferase domain-containing protein [Phycicoccus sp. BSK3Z-2]|uniref:NTP transferase domain-containing protein n=1 Tax=Phycicoccus avicenniae TaxID=2828860 RepID=A0A941D9G4_9MICO|nr:mannose-1-phosphate guanylyltransferase [Phycicoccus avicenniae]MBR7743553.1 NTP transferase domain-containing protein [Phycicoccus avicenniae]